MSSKRVVCAGAYPALQRTLFMDSFEAGAVNRIRRVRLDVAGKAVNAARGLLRLGADPVLAGFSGEDSGGGGIETFLEAEGLDTRGLLRVAEPVRICQTLLSADGRAFTELVEEGPRLTDAYWRALIDHVKYWLDLDEAVPLILAGSMPGHAAKDFYPALIEAGRGFVLLDTSGDALLGALASGPDLVKINAGELARTLGVVSVSEEGEIVALSRRLLASGARAVGITQGAGTAYLVTGASVWRYVMPVVSAVSALGSGDCVNAGVVFGMHSELRTLEQAFLLGLACGVANAETTLPGHFSVERVRELEKAIDCAQLQDPG